MTPGQAVKSARRKKGWTQERLGKEVGLAQATISALEHDECNSRLDSQVLIKVAQALDDQTVLVQHCEQCPVRLHLLKKHFSFLEDRRQDLASIASQLREEMGKAYSALDELAEVVSDADFRERSEDREQVRLLFEQIREIERGIGILRFQMMLDKLI